MKFAIGLFLGITLNSIVTQLWYCNFKKPKYNVGTCLSNGLFYEQITSIRYGNVTNEVRYELSSYIQGRLSTPSTTETWIVDQNYVKVNEENCKEKK